MLASNTTLRSKASELRRRCTVRSQCWRQPFGTTQNIKQLGMPNNLHKAEKLEHFHPS
jgi:hypothetical protein